MNEFRLNKVDKQYLLILARQSILDHLKGVKSTGKMHMQPGNSMMAETGAFVTLRKKGKLRGCIGTFGNKDPLYKVIQNMAIAAATNDHRFEPVTLEELDQLHIEISVLTPLKLINNIDEIELGRHGIYIKQAYHSGTFLPQVATDTGWTLEEFLGHCSRDKAHIGWTGWKNANIYTYEALVFEEE